MAGLIDRCRRLVVRGRPVATGVAAVADAWRAPIHRWAGVSCSGCCMPSACDVARAELDDPLHFALAWDQVTEAELMPWYRATVAVDRVRLAQIEALRMGKEPEPPLDPTAAMGAALVTAMAYDADVFRGFLEVVGCLALPREVLARPGFADRVMEVARSNEPRRTPGPTREELLELLA